MTSSVLNIDFVENKFVTIPDFFIVGAPKCGTTSLYEWLGDHPLINAPHKETCFFSQDIFPTSSLATHIPSLEEYSSIFTLHEEQRISGEATPKYLYSNQALSEISALQPDARIIVCLRDPVELAISLYNQKLREGVEKEPSFEKAWAASLAALDGTGPALPHERHYYLWACIGSRLQKLHEYFASDSVLILLASELRADPRGCYLKVLSFLDLPDDGRRDFSSHNERAAIRSLPVHRGVLALKRFFDPALRPLYYLRNGKGLGLLKLINRFNMQRGRYAATVSEEFKQDMRGLLVGEIDQAESFLNGRCLSGRRN